MSETSNETSRILRHTEAVRNYVERCALELLERGRRHDQSKLQPEEFETYCRVQPLLRATVYGSDEYKAACRELGPALKHHQATNRHHPEFHKDGIAGMTLIDLMEMLCDWKASGLRSPDGDLLKSVSMSSERFGIDPQLKAVLENTAKWLNGLTVEHRAEES